VTGTPAARRRPCGYGRPVPRVDHVIVAVADLDAAAERLEGDLGLGSQPGGVHPDYGTANRIVPVGGGSYLELMAVHDPELAGRTPIGRWLVDRLAGGGGPAGWMIAPDDFEATVARLGLTVAPGSRRLPDGSQVEWRLAGIGSMLREAPLPSFIAWDVPPERHPSATVAPQRQATAGIAWVEVAGDARRVGEWLGPEAGGLDVRFVQGPPALRRVGLALADGGELVLG
jgi:hypothetical protein